MELASWSRTDKRPAKWRALPFFSQTEVCGYIGADGPGKRNRGCPTDWLDSLEVETFKNETALADRVASGQLGVAGAFCA
jgi:hypothetical protein